MCNSCPEHSNKLSWAKINSFPIKHKDMSIEEMRDLCVKFFRYSKMCQWKPAEDLHYIRGKKKTIEEDIFEKNLYGGLPYIGLATGSVYRMMDWYDEESGVMDIKTAMETPLIFGNMCSLGAFWGWARVINSANYTWTPNMTQFNGFLRVGPYTYDDNLENFYETPTKGICEENDKQVMYRSYAEVKAADGFVQYAPEGGHVIMCTKNPTVITTPKGNVDGKLSTLEITEQGQAWRFRKDEFGTTFCYKSNIDRIFTFEQLYESGYLPFTFAEFQGTHPIEDTVCEIDLEKSEVTLEDLKSATVSTNYAISDLYAIAKDENGNEKYRHAERAMQASLKTLSMSNIEEGFAGYEGEALSIEIICQLGTGERPTVYQGTLIG